MNAVSLPLGDQQVQYMIDGRLIPVQFPYLSVLLQGRPRHGGDEFSLRHPRMERGKRAKLFAPFDALDGYSDSLEAKHVLYTERVTPDEETQAEIGRRLAILRELTRNGRLAKINRPRVTAVYYVPCADEQSFACGVRGQYVSVTGDVRRVDPDVRRALTVEDTTISFDDLLSLEAAQPGLFDGRLRESPQGAIMEAGPLEEEE